MSQIPLPSVAKFAQHQASRPVLARDADSMYWMSRYIERAEHVARLLTVNSNLLVDVGDLAPDLQERQWMSVLTIMRSNPPERDNASDTEAGLIPRYMTFDRSNPNSLMTCVSRARENARGIRENISAEMWECVNTLYWSIRGDDSPSRFEESPDTFYRQIMNGSMLFQGLTDQTLDHDQRWRFAQLGKYLERID
ncbi:MAG TPA: alpha-E domain-containing protein, partial [Tepidisphaeraceae bacterium]|nr:alpha-E domain-containing protein [Tepidisphaeraceae bacterium]